MEETQKEPTPITMILYVIQNDKKEPTQNWEIIPKKTYIVGRSKKEADISINEKLLSRKQAELTYYDSTKIIVKDLESRNGTFLNKVKIAPLKNFYFNADDVLSFGTTNNEIVFFNQNEKNEPKKVDLESESDKNKILKKSTLIQENHMTKSLIIIMNKKIGKKKEMKIEMKIEIEIGIGIEMMIEKMEEKVIKEKNMMNIVIINIGINLDLHLKEKGIWINPCLIEIIIKIIEIKIMIIKKEVHMKEEMIIIILKEKKGQKIDIHINLTQDQEVEKEIEIGTGNILLIQEKH